MKKKLLIVSLLLVLMTMTVFAGNPEFIKLDSPILITSFGQNPDTNFVKMLSKRAKIPYTYLIAAEPSEIDWNEINAVVGVLGGSGKGLGHAGLSVQDEQNRIETIINDAHAHGKKVIGMHIGGMDRRGPNSEAFLEYAGMVDFMVVKANGNPDHYFDPICADAGVPMYTVTSTIEIQKVLTSIFK